MLACDFHLHSFYSKDSYLPPKFIARYMRKLGYSAIAITDHDSVAGSLEAKKVCRHWEDFLVISGQEVKTEKGEIIVLGCEVDLKGKSMEEIIDLARENGWLTILPHPADLLRTSALIRKVSEGGMLEIARKCDAVECFNSRCVCDLFNLKARKLAGILEKPCVAGSDAHTLSELGSAKTLVRAEMSEESVLGAVKKGETEIEGKINFLLNHGKSFIVKFERILKEKNKKIL